MAESQGCPDTGCCFPAHTLARAPARLLWVNLVAQHKRGGRPRVKDEMGGASQGDCMKEHLDFSRAISQDKYSQCPGCFWGAGEGGVAAGPAWEDKALTAHSPAARTKVLNKKIHLDVHPWETLVN